MEFYTQKTVQKIKRLNIEYEKFLYKKIADPICEISELPAIENTAEARSRFYTEMPKSGWKRANPGDKWGGDFRYAWFRCNYTVSDEFAGKKLLLRPDTGLAEGLLFINGKPAGMFDKCPDIQNLNRLHDVQPLTFCAKAGETFEIAVECYAGHPVPGTRPYDNGDMGNIGMYPVNTVRTFNSVDVVLLDETVAEFLTLHRTVAQIIDFYGENAKIRADAVNAFCELIKILPQLPCEVTFDWHPALEKANGILRDVTAQKRGGEEFGYVGLIGHSHLDTAWLWPVRETLHKAARTFSNALRIMERYPDYHYIQSSVVYIDWMKKYYPDIYEKMKKMTAAGRWEPNGGAWVECDNNIPSGEYIVRQFLIGQRYTKENFGYLADCFWQLDTFGYSSAIPQILRKCGIKYFLTTKLSWNEANEFPYDSFIWKGLDGTEVLTHFNISYAWPDVKDIKRAVLPNIKHSEVSNMKLLSYGFGDGGGGPSYSMLESEKTVKGMAGMPELESTTVSAFMHRLEESARNLPVFSGELYLELHRGTLTQMHEIKRSNRMLEKAIHNYELLSVTVNGGDEELRGDSVKTLLVNQFHDILPGTCIAEAHDVAIYENKKAISRLTDGMKSFFDGGRQVKSLCNTLSFDRSDQIILKNTDFSPDNRTVQEYTDIYGDKCTAVSGVTLKAFSIQTLVSGKPKPAECPFKVEGNSISTPFADIVMENGRFISYKTKRGAQAVFDAAVPFNTLYFGEDIPEKWDNWDIDYDQAQIMKPVTECVSSEVVSVGALQLRIRVKYKFGDSSLSQDIVFYSDNPRIDFESVVDWNSPHSLLKVGFKVNVLSDTARFETQFGNIKRPTHENYGTDKTQFEVCNHKWTDLSDTRFGVAVLNDCKYGISVKDNDMRLTLHKGGCRPDPRGDRGVHRFTYSLLVHESAFSAEAVIRPAYELNYPVLAFDGACARGDRGSLLSVDAGNVIIETVKPAEDKEGVIVRAYEAEGTFTRCKLTFDAAFGSVFITDMLEYENEPVDIKDNTVLLDFKPFEIKTLRLKGKS